MDCKTENSKIMNNLISEVCEYELVDISWSLSYEFKENSSLRIHDDDDASPEQLVPSSVIERDAEGIPMGQTMEEIREREHIISVFFSTWYEAHTADSRIFNCHLNGYINIRNISIEEAKHHASKSYLSTIAVVRYFEDILANAFPIRRVPTKVGNRNQSQFDYMLVMKHVIDSVGTVKLTVGVKQPKNSTELKRTEYGISVLRPGQELIDEKALGSTKKQKARHKANNDK